MGSSQAMEFAGFKKSLNFLISEGLSIDKLITDRHLAIAKYMQETHLQISHLYDMWHIRKSNY